jgi:hypothetical protein
MKHTKIGNGYGGYEHAANETACGLPGKGRKQGDYNEATCPNCIKQLKSYFGADCLTQQQEFTIGHTYLF